MKFDSAWTLLMAASFGILSEHGCNGQNETLLMVNETLVLNETHVVAEVRHTLINRLENTPKRKN